MLVQGFVRLLCLLYSSVSANIVCNATHFNRRKKLFWQCHTGATCSSPPSEESLHVLLTPKWGWAWQNSTVKKTHLKVGTARWKHCEGKEPSQPVEEKQVLGTAWWFDADPSFVYSNCYGTTMLRGYIITLQTLFIIRNLERSSHKAVNKTKLEDMQPKRADEQRKKVMKNDVQRHEEKKQLIFTKEFA